MVKVSAYNAGDLGLLGWEDPHFSVPAWKIPWTESLVGYSPWGCKESDATE